MKTSLILTALATFFVAVSAHATQVVLHTTHGDIQVELDDKNAPISSENFIQYAKSGFYNGTIFHRVMDGFMIQGGGFTSGMKSKSTRSPIQNEADNRLPNQRGTIAMARTSEPHSATSQFFINLVDNEFLNHRGKEGQNWGYAVFGKVTNGMEVVDSIAKVKTARSGFHQNVPVEDVVIKSVTIK